MMICNLWSLTRTDMDKLSRTSNDATMKNITLYAGEQYRELWVMRCLLVYVIGTKRAFVRAGCNSSIVIIKVLDLWIVMVAFLSVGQNGHAMLNGERGRDMGSRDTRNDARKSERASQT